MSDPASAMSNEVLLAAFAAIQILSMAMSKVIDYFIERNKLDPIETKVDSLLVSDVKRQAILERMVERKAEDGRMIADLYAMHKVIDEDGRPVWYFPKKMLDMADEHLEMLREIAMAQRETALEMKSIVNQLVCMKEKRRD